MCVVSAKQDYLAELSAEETSDNSMKEMSDDDGDVIQEYTYSNVIQETTYNDAMLQTIGSEVIKEKPDLHINKAMIDDDVIKEMLDDVVIQTTDVPSRTRNAVETADTSSSSSIQTLVMPNDDLIQNDSAPDDGLVQSHPEPVCDNTIQTAPGPRKGSMQNVSPVGDCHTKPTPGNEQNGLDVDDVADWPVDMSVGDVIIESKDSSEKLRESRKEITATQYALCELFLHLQ